jgi:flagellar biosynthesis component FlhA
MKPITKIEDRDRPFFRCSTHLTDEGVNWMDVRVGLSLYLLSAFLLMVLALIFDAPHIYLIGLVIALIAGLSYPWLNQILQTRKDETRSSSRLEREKAKREGEEQEIVAP